MSRVTDVVREIVVCFGLIHQLRMTVMCCVYVCALSLVHGMRYWPL